MSQKKTLTIAINGDVPLREFSKAIGGLCDLVYALTEELAWDANIRWEIDALETGSAVATIAGIADDARPLAIVIAAYADVGKALRERATIPFSPRVDRAAREVANVINGSISSIMFETEDDEPIYISARIAEGPRPSSPSHAIGTIKGTVESLSRRRGVRFTVYDSLFDKPIGCYLEPGHESEIKDFWGRKVLVSGIIARDPDNGRPVSVRRVTQIKAAEGSAPGSYKDAIGVIQLDKGESPESIIRKIRDAQ